MDEMIFRGRGLTSTIRRPDVSRKFESSTILVRIASYSAIWVLVYRESLAVGSR